MIDDSRVEGIIEDVTKGWLVIGIMGLIGAGCAGGPEASSSDEGDETAVEEIGPGGAVDPVAGGEEAENPLPEPRGLKMEETFVGEVNYVSGSDGFVLIEVAVSASIEPGERLFSRSADGRETGEMKLSPERKRWYLIGDIISGYPQVGDRIYYKRAVEGAPPTTEEGNRDQRRGSKKKNSGERRFGGR